MADGAHVSIGDVLDQLRPEFDDITISKIRFLESQGLIDPERTPSGYRKFYPSDVERLRFILREQREHFLPLKVIKERLADLDSGAPHSAAEPEPEPAGVVAPVADADSGAPPAKKRRGKAPVAEPLFETTRRAAEFDEARAATNSVRDDGGPDDYTLAQTEVVLTRPELAKAAGITDEELGQLEEYGLIIPAHTSRDRVLFDEDALAIARVASSFLRHGIEARHLRMYRAFAEREAGLFEQVLLPYRRQRNPEAQARTRDTLGELWAWAASCAPRCSAKPFDVRSTADVPATVLLDADAVGEQVRRLGAEIAADHPDGVVLIGVLKGALLFVADLSRAITGIPVEVDFMAISRFAPDSGRVRILHDVGTDITGRDVVVVEDMVDTGLTLAYLMGQLAERNPRRLSACTLLDRPSRRIVPHDLRYCGLKLENEFVLGYGLHARDLYRNLPFIAAGDREVVAATPDAYVSQLYAEGRQLRAEGNTPGGR